MRHKRRWTTATPPRSRKFRAAASNRIGSGTSSREAKAYLAAQRVLTAAAGEGYARCEFTERALASRARSHATDTLHSRSFTVRLHASSTLRTSSSERWVVSVIVAW